MSACPTCGEPVSQTDAFCENCGSTLTVVTTQAATVTVASQSSPDGEQSARTHLFTPAGADNPPAPTATQSARNPCATCGGEVGGDGYCTVCGIKASNGREHVVDQPDPAVAGVSDRGLAHTRNEDAMALAVRAGWSALVVCDGVTTSTDSDVASLAAATAARDLHAAAPRPSSGSPAARVTHWSEQLKAAAEVAGDAAAKTSLIAGDTANPPSCTFVAAVADGQLIVAGWVGDSRAYWLPDHAVAEQLSVDDSWATEQIARGVPREAAEADPRAHAITKWLGSDSPVVDASTSTTTVVSPGWLLVCSDGLWNYCSGAADLAELVASQQKSDPAALAEALVAWANEQGGHDNVTVTLARLAPVPAAEGAS